MDDARSDLALASIPLPRHVRFAALCFHAQQAAEKAVKAIYIKNGWIFPFVHDLGALVTGLSDHGVMIPPEIRQSALLTRHAIRTRYSGMGDSVAEEDWRKAVRIAEDVVRWAEAQVDNEPA
ncbi:MAG: HEPN domain-containing protein [Planctomycetes bacterium]|nr:HEPN domain-containing protein [Planctomycetota bacterium]